MSVVVELDSSLLKEAEHATGLSVPVELVERALRQMIRVEAYRTSVMARGLNLTEEQILQGQALPFMTVETYQPEHRGEACDEKERQRILTQGLEVLDKNDTLSPEQKAAYRGLIELGGSDPTATAAPRRRFW